MEPITRYEIKYRMSPPQASLVRDWMSPFMEPDPNGEGGCGAYHIHSLYLDGPDWSIYRETRAGAFARFKLRARTYSFNPDAPVFLEVKARKGESMRKTRVEMDRDEACRIVGGDLPLRAPTPDALEDFRSKLDLRRAIPRVWVTYRRAAFVGDDRLGLVRITFDTDIAWAPSTAALAEPPRWLPVSESKGLVILELKYHGSYPGWVADLVRHFDLERKAMSKYRYAVDDFRARERVQAPQWQERPGAQRVLAPEYAR